MGKDWSIKDQIVLLDDYELSGISTRYSPANDQKLDASNDEAENKEWIMSKKKIHLTFYLASIRKTMISEFSSLQKAGKSN